MKEEPLLLIPWTLKDKGKIYNLYEIEQFFKYIIYKNYHQEKEML